MSLSGPLASWLFAAPAAAPAATSEERAVAVAKPHNSPFTHRELGRLLQQPCSPLYSPSVTRPYQPMNAAQQAPPPQAPVVLPSSCLRRRISDSSSSCSGDDEGESAATCSDKHGNYHTPSLNKAKRRRRLRVGFESQIVQRVHPYPDYASSDPDNTNEDGPPPASALWYTHSELLAMKRVAKRTCARNRESLEYALNDAYQRQPQPHQPQQKQAPLLLPSESAAAAAEISDDSEQEASSRSRGATALSPALAPHVSDTRLSHSSTPDELGDDDIRAIQQHLLSIPAFRELRGMERWSSQCHALSRGLTMLQVKTEVFVLQAQHATQTAYPRSPAAGVDCLSHAPQQCLHLQQKQEQCDELHARDLSRACSEASAPAMRFARLMGRLDAVVARETENCADDYESSDELQEETM
jgi:hypothetical protein